MTKAQRLSVTLSAAQVRLLKRRAKRSSLESVLKEALEEVARREAQERLLKSYGKAAVLSDDEFERIRAEWQA